jgi:thioredoxin-like negative regulator of GroEL
LSEYSVEEFDNEIEIHETIFVKFFSPQCPHCKSMAADFVKTGKDVREFDPPIVVAEVDCSSDIGEHICAKKNIKEYPTLQLYKYGSFYNEYKGSRDRKKMTNWLKAQNNDKTKRFSSIQDMDDAIRESNEIVVAGVFKTPRINLFNTFLKTSLEVKRDYPVFKDILFYHTFVEDEMNLNSLAKKTFVVLQGAHLIETKGKIYLHRPKWIQSKLENDTEVYSSDSKTSLKTWIVSRAHGTIGIRTKMTDNNIHDPLKVGMIVVTYLPFDLIARFNESSSWRDRLIPFARQFTNIKFLVSKTTDYYEHLKQKVNDIPHDTDACVKPIVIGYDNLTVPYVMQEDFSEDSFVSFLNMFVSGQLEGNLKMIEPEKKPLWKVQQENVTVDDSKIRDVTAKNFSSLISFTENHVLLLLYKNKSETKTQKINRVMDDLQNEYEKVIEKGLSFFRMNCTENEVPRAFDIFTLPRLFFIHSRSKKISRFKHVIDKPKVQEFMEKEARSGKKELYTRKTIAFEKAKSEL